MKYLTIATVLLAMAVFSVFLIPDREYREMGQPTPAAEGQEADTVEVAATIEKPSDRAGLYDIWFRKYGRRFFGAGFDWRWFKAQGVAESDLNPEAESPCRARGIMQLLPSTHRDIVRRNPWIEGNILSPRWNIAAGVCYDRDLWDKWGSPMFRVATHGQENQLRFTFASYNAGYGRMLQARKVCRDLGLDPDRWGDIAVAAPHVARWRHRETLGYLERIFRVKEGL